MSRPLGLGYLVFAGLVGAVAGVYIFAPQVPRGWFAPPARPADEGPVPVLTGDMQVSMEARDHETALATTVRVAAPVKVAVATAAAAPAATAAPAAPVLGTADAKGKALLDEAWAAYRVYQWTKAMSAARMAMELNVSPALRQGARDVMTNAPVVANLFSKLNDRDELTRNYDTNPSLVTLSGGRDLTYAVPILGGDNKDPQVVDKDPLGFIAQQRLNGVVNFLVRGNKGFIATELKDEAIGQVKLVDQLATRKERQVRLDGYRKSLTGALARDPMAWYDVGRFAFQNRLDTAVVDSLHQAVLLDPKLAQTVREDRAAVLFASLVTHVKNNNKTQAAIYMGLIERKYKDTDQGRQARLYFDGKTAELLAMAKEAERQAELEEQRRKAEATKRAKELADQQAANVAANATPAPVPVEDTTPPEPDVATITGKPDEAKAQQLFEQGAKLCSDAIDKGNTPERDRLYGEAIKVLAQAVPMLSKLAENEKDPKKKEALQAKMVEANQMKFGATKMRRPAH